MSIKGFKAKDGTIHKYDYESLEGRPEGEQGESGGYYTPVVEQRGENTVTFSFTPSNEEMPKVQEVTVELPRTGGGLSSAEKSLLLSLFANAVYTCDMSATITTLANLWGGGTVEPDVPDEPGEDVAQTGSILSIVSGVTATKNGVVLAIA